MPNMVCTKKYATCFSSGPPEPGGRPPPPDFGLNGSKIFTFRRPWITKVAERYLFHINRLNQNFLFSDIKYRQNIALLWEVSRVFWQCFACIWYHRTNIFGSSRLCETGHLYTFPILYMPPPLPPDFQTFLRHSKDKR